MPEQWEATRATLHAYALAVSALPRAHATPHPRWWHVSLEMTPNGLATEAIALPNGGAATIMMNLTRHDIAFETSDGQRSTFPMTDGLTGTEMGEALIAVASEHGLGEIHDRARFENEDARIYDVTHAEAFLEALQAASNVLEIHRLSLAGDAGPVQLWPHGFDIAFEWFGKGLKSRGEEAGETAQTAQINFGFYPAGDAYFYSSPWPFDSDSLLLVDLPSGARWNTDGWDGSMLAYSETVGRSDGVERVLAYMRAVFSSASPALAE